MNLRTYLPLSLAVLAVATAASAQENVTNLKPFRRLTAPAPITINTLDFYPQVDPGYSLKTIRPENESGFNPPVFDANSLFVGENTNVQNVSTPGPKFPAIDATGWTPPDPDIAVGPNHVVVVVNSSLAFLTKAGVKTFERTFGSFFSSLPGLTSFLFDPKAFYDPISKRFFVLACEQSGSGNISKACIGVSDDSDPNGNWRMYRIETKQTVSGSDFWLDYPGFGFNKDAVVITGNMFGFSGGYNGIQYICIPKAPLLTGGTPTVSYLSTPGGTAHPARTIDATLDRVYVVNFSSTSAAKVAVITSPATNPQLTTRDVSIPTWTGPTPSDSTSGHQLDGLDGRTLNCFYRGGRLVFTHTARPSGGENNACRWYEIATNGFPASNPTLVQAGNVKGQAGQFFSMPAITSNSKGDIAMVFARSSSSIVMDFMAAGRKRTDPIGTMGAPKLLQTSEGSTYGGTGVNRFGDYFGIGVDPKDDTTFWGVGMIARGDGGWRTVVNSFQITPPSGTGGGLPVYRATSISMVTGTGSFGGVTEVQSTDDRYFTIGSTPVDRTGHVAAAEATFTLDKLGSQFTQLGLDLEAAAATGCTSSFYAWNWTTGAYEYIGATPAGATDVRKTIAIQAANITRYVNGSKQVKILVRGVSPIGTNRNPVPFNYRLDLVQLFGETK